MEQDSSFSKRTGCRIPAIPFFKFHVIVPRPVKKGFVPNPIFFGEKIRNKRLELQLLQKDVAKIIGVSKDSITLWETNKVKPLAKNYFKAIQLLGDSPTSRNSSLQCQIKNFRYRHGLSQKQLGKKVKVDSSTICNWETGQTRPKNQYLKRLEECLSNSVCAIYCKI